MHTIEAMMRKTQATRLREPMTRVPVFKELHAQQLDNFGRVIMSKDLKLKVANKSGC